MDTVLWPVLGTAHVAPAEFVRFWDRLYSGYDEGFYRDNVGQPLTEERIAGWFRWKNGTPLAPRKAASIRRYLSPDERIGADAGAAALAAYLNRPGGAIWRIFWLHLQHPLRFPIYDQHVHRAMAFLLGWPAPEIPAHNPAKVRAYLDHYLPFFGRFSDCCEHRQADRALWAFGRFLKSKYAGLIAPPPPQPHGERQAGTDPRHAAAPGGSGSGSGGGQAEG